MPADSTTRPPRSYLGKGKVRERTQDRALRLVQAGRGLNIDVGTQLFRTWHSSEVVDCLFCSWGWCNGANGDGPDSLLQSVWRGAQGAH